MARHLIKPDAAPWWADFAFGRVGLADGSPLQLRVVSVTDPFNAEDLELLALAQTSSPEGGLAEVQSYLVAIYNAMTSMFAE